MRIDPRIVQISPFEPPHTHQVGELYLDVRQALDLLSKTWTQSPHWDHEPTTEELELESQWNREAEEASKDLIYKAAEIFTRLTGERIPEGWLDKMAEKK